MEFEWLQRGICCQNPYVSQSTSRSRCWAPKYALILENRPIDDLFPMNDEQEAIRLEREADVAEGKTPGYDAAEYLELLRKRGGNA